MKSTRSVYVVAVAVLALLYAGCVREYKVTIINHLDVPVTIEMAQYHSEGFDRTPPGEFTDDLLVETRQLSLKAGERRATVFNDATGGFWLRWHQVEPPSDDPVLTLDLIRDPLTITIKQVGGDGV